METTNKLITPKTGDIVEFKCNKGKETFVDRVNEVCVFSCGKLEVWSELYPELSRGAFNSNQIIRIIELSKIKVKKCPPFPYKIGDKIKCSADLDFYTGIIKEIWWIISDGDPTWRCITDIGSYIYDEDVVGLAE